MRTIAVIARKGGSGKTTLAVQLALAAHRRGLNTLLADIDPQRSAMEALRTRERPGPSVVATTGPKLFALQLSYVRGGGQVMVIDTAAAAEDALAAAIVVADLNLLVVRPTFLDLAAAARTADVARRLKRRFVGVLNQAPPPRRQIEAPLVHRALRGLEAGGIRAATSIVRSRAIYQAVMADGRSVEEAGDVAAAAEIAGLWAFVDTLTSGRADSRA